GPSRNKSRRLTPPRREGDSRRGFLLPAPAQMRRWRITSGPHLATEEHAPLPHHPGSLASVSTTSLSRSPGGIGCEGAGKENRPASLVRLTGPSDRQPHPHGLTTSF